MTQFVILSIGVVVIAVAAVLVVVEGVLEVHKTEMQTTLLLLPYQLFKKRPLLL